jgi:hypothetical protein
VQRILNWFHGGPRPRRADRRGPVSRLCLEHLEDRLAPATLSAVPIAASPGEVFAVTSTHSLVYVKNGGPPVTISPAGTVLSASAGRVDDCWAVMNDHSLRHWHLNWDPSPYMPAGTVSEEICTTAQPGEVYAIRTDLALIHHTSAGWDPSPLAPAGTVLKVSADQVGDVFAVFSNHSLWENTAKIWKMLLPPNAVLSISAGPSGDVFAVSTGHALLWHHGITWTQLSGPGTIEAVSAGATDEVYAVTTQHALEHLRITPVALIWQQLAPPGSMTDSISADYNGDVFAVPINHALLEHTAVWVQRDVPGSML